MWLNLSEYCRQRGCSSVAVKKAILAGRLKESVRQKSNGKWQVNPETANIEWQINTRAPAFYGRVVPLGFSLPAETTKSDQRNMSVLYQARIMHEVYRAKLTKLDYDERIGKLVDAEKVKNENFKLARMVRDAMLTIPDRLAAEVAGMTDPVAVHQKMLNEIRRAIQSLQPV